MTTDEGRDMGVQVSGKELQKLMEVYINMGANEYWKHDSRIIGGKKKKFLNENVSC